MKTSLKAMLLCTVFCLILSSCSDSKDDEVKINESSISLYYEETKQLEASGSNNIAWSTDNNFVAKVSNNGMVTANHVGKTIIRANDAICEVTVKPKHNLYKDPITEWGITKSEVIKRLGTPDEDSGNIIGYVTNNSKAPITMYMFENDKLTTACPSVMISYTATLLDFLIERYQPVDVNVTDLTATFINAMTFDESTIAVHIAPNLSLGMYLTMYINPHTKTRSMNDSYEEQLLDFIESFNL